MRQLLPKVRAVDEEDRRSGVQLVKVLDLAMRSYDAFRMRMAAEASTRIRQTEAEVGGALDMVGGERMLPRSRRCGRSQVVVVVA